MDLAGTDVYMYGIGQQETTQKRIQVESHWKDFLKSHGAKTIDLKILYFQKLTPLSST
jgi:hypothetical protein